MILKIVGVIFIGVLLLSIWFGSKVLLDIFAKKLGLKFLYRFNAIIASIIPTIIILIVSKRFFVNVSSITDYISWIIIIITVLITIIIVSFAKNSKKRSSKEIALSALDGFLMEIPQRLMMQSLMILLLIQWNVNEYYSILATAIVWGIGIVIQTLIMKSGFTKKFICEIVASVVFSIGVGIVLVRTDFIGFTMLAHFSERLISAIIQNKRASKISDKQAL